VSDFNRVIRGPREPGRPLAASEAQIEEVRALHKDGKSRRFIVGRTGLGERTMRTIIEKKQGKDRTSRKRAFERKLFKDKLRAAAYRSKIKQRDDYLPKRINVHQKTADELIKAAKGLGKR
jgi:hypothetical protein